MDPRLSAQDVVRCDLCKDNVVHNYCDYCHVKLCKLCIGEHISDEYDKHKIVPFQQRKSTLIFPICKTHSTETCKLQCQSCNNFICTKCSLSKEHKDHNVECLEERYNSKKENLQKDTEEIENVISPIYEEIRKELESQIASLDGEYEKINTIVSKQGEEWHKEIDRAIEQMKNEINEIKVNHRGIMKNHLKEIEQIEYSIKENISTLKDLQQESNVVSKVMEYRSRNIEFSKIPPNIHISFPSFCPEPMDIGKVEKLIGSIKPLTFTTNENGHALTKQMMGPLREMMDTPEVINTFNTRIKKLKSVSFYSEEKIWTCADDIKIKCFNFKGDSNNASTVKSKNFPCDIAVTSEGCLLYSDCILQTINKVVDGQVEKLIKFQEWIPTNLHVTFSGDLLVVVSDVAGRRSKVARYSSSIETQTIQFGEDGKPLYSGDYKVKFITENKNLDICVADRAANAVVVVNQAGKLRFRYTGHPTKPFVPRGITTNSQGQILTADGASRCIHILDQDGQFLRHIDNITFDDPNGMCVDALDNLYVAEYSKGDVKVIRYLK